MKKLNKKEKAAFYTIEMFVRLCSIMILGMIINSLFFLFYFFYPNVINKMDILLNTYEGTPATLLIGLIPVGFVLIFLVVIVWAGMLIVRIASRKGSILLCEEQNEEKGLI